MLYKEWLNDWLENYVSPSAKQRTYARYSDVVQKRLIPKFGDVDVSALTPYVMHKYITELTQRGNVMTGKGLSTNTVNSIIAVIQGSLRTAYSLGLIETYTMDKIKRPKGQEKAVSCFSKQPQITPNRKIYCELLLVIITIIQITCHKQTKSGD